MGALRTCAACGFRVEHASPACAVCGWLDDAEQLRHPDFVVGSNARSLREAQRRRPTQSDRYTVDPAWRPLRPDEHPGQADGGSPACMLGGRDDADDPYWLNCS